MEFLKERTVLTSGSFVYTVPAYSIALIVSPSGMGQA